MASDEFIMDAKVEKNVVTGIIDEDAIKPTKDINRSILEPMKIKPLQIPQQFIDQMLASYEEVCVNDHGDMYHMTEEERIRSNRLYSIFLPMLRMKIKHRTLDTYVLAFRETLKVVEALGKENKFYAQEDFVKKVLSGKIKVSGLKIPRFIGKHKKDVDWNTVAEYIIDSTLDVSDLVRKKNNQFWEVITEDDVAYLEDIYGMDIQEYVEKMNEEYGVDIQNFDPEEDDGSGRNVIVPFTKSEQRKFLAGNSGVLQGIKEARKQSSDVTGFRDYAYSLTCDAFDEIKELDSRKKYLRDIPEFHGNALSRKDVRKYMNELEEYERANVKIEINKRYYSADDWDSIQLKNLMEQSGLNVRKFPEFDMRAKEEKRQERDRKKIAKLKEKLSSVKKRKEEREAKLYGGVNSKKKKKKKKEKDIKKKITPRTFDSWENYQSMMEDDGEE